MLATNPKSAPPRQRLSEWTPEMERLTDLYDLVNEVIRVLVALKGGKPGNSKPLPRPVSALDRAKARKRQAKHRSLVARMLPHVQHGDSPPA
ncbi:hypothetical protein ACIBTV_27225 [Micromonospora sp. NPDC049366]|uniref:hypothetical protein n=1 Tax=Micromonospora sp. NPDC049366 TaxID=3364271 RepID=UPI00378F658B